MNNLPFELPLEISLQDYATFFLIYVDGNPSYTILYQKEASENLSHVCSGIEFGLDPDGNPSFDYIFDKTSNEDENYHFYHPLTTMEAFIRDVKKFLESCKEDYEKEN